MNILVLSTIPASVLPKAPWRRFTSRHSAAMVAALAVVSCLATALQAQSPLDGFDPKANQAVYSIAVQANGKALVGGLFTTLSPNGGAAVTRNNLARLNPDGTVDALFNPNANGSVHAIAVQADGKILIGGDFTSLSPNGGAAVVSNRIARLNPNGTVDASFNLKADNVIQSIAVQADGSILIGGYFHTLSVNGGAPVIRKRVARLNPDGTLDTAFNPNVSDGVLSVVVEADGRILIGGLFYSLSPNGGALVLRTHIARLNPNGTLDPSFDPSPKGSPEVSSVMSIALQADHKILMGGLFTTLSPNGGTAVTRNYMARVNPDGTLDSSFNPNANNAVSAIAVQPDGKILIGGWFTALSPNGGATVTRNHIARLNPNGTLDASFNPRPSGGSLVSVNKIAVQPDGKIVMGGKFTTLSPKGIAVMRDKIARLHPDGRLDQTLNLKAVGSDVVATSVQTDGKILIGGGFTEVLGVKRNRMARLQSDGTLDVGFDPNANGAIRSITAQLDGKILIGGFFTNLSPNGGIVVKRNKIARLNLDGTVDALFDPHPESDVWSIVVQADGKILIGGQFTSLAPNGGAPVPHKFLARLNPNGTPEPSFDPNPDKRITSIARQGDGKILIGGNFTALSPNGGVAVTRNHIARLNPDGSLDHSFNPNPNNEVYAIAVQGDGKILIGGDFTSLSPNGEAAVTRNHIARLHSDGTLDASFNPNLGPLLSTEITSMALQANGKILIGGEFTTLSPNGGAAITRHGMARLNPVGTLDSFDPNAASKVSPTASILSITQQGDGKILIGGPFHTFSPNGGAVVTRELFARLTNDAAALQNLTSTQTTITWTRGGASPELSRVTFERSIDDGVSYTFLGDGTRVGTTSDFTLTGLILPTGQNILIRARGFYHGGIWNSSESVTESVRNVYFF